MRHFLTLLIVCIKTTVLFGQLDSVEIKKVEELISDFYVKSYENPDSAIIILDTAEALAKRIHYSKGITSAMRQRGMFYNERTDYVKSLGMLFAALKEDEKIKNDDGIAMDLLYIGLSYFQQQKMDEALIQMNKALLKYTEIKDDAGMALVNANMGMVYRNMNRFEDALKCYFLVRNFYIQDNNDNNLSRVENNIGNVYKDLKQYDRALQHFMTALDLKKKGNDVFGLVVVYSNIGDIYVEKKDFQKAFDYYYKALKITEDQKSLSQQKDVYFDLSYAYQQKGDYKQAYENYKRSTELKDSILTDKYNSDLADMKVKYESEKKENENTILKNDNELQDVKIAEEKKQKLFFASLALLVFIAGLLVFVQYRNKQKLSKQLAQINEKVNNQNSTLRTLNTELIRSEENLTKANSTKDQLISMLSHDLYNPITSVINYSGHIVATIDEMKQQELRSSFVKVNNAVIPLRDLLDNILQWAQIQKQQIAANIEEVDVNIVLADIVQLYKPGAELKGVALKFTPVKNGVIFSDRLMLYFVLRNVINNAVKFSSEKNEINVEAICKENEFLISIKDHGIGFSEETLKELNSFSDDISIIAQGAGVGLSISRQFVKLLNAKMEFKNRGEGGAEVVLYFKV